MANYELKAILTADDQASSKIKTLGNAVSSLGDRLGKDLKYAAIGAGAGLVALAGFAVKSATDVQMLRTNLDVLTGSAEKGAKMFDSLYKMAAKTPFETADLVRATQMMLGYGIAQEKILPNLKMLGDVALGNKEKFAGLTYAFSQVQATGRLMGQDLMQMVNQGFNPLAIISEKTGKSMAELKKDMENGAISADMVTEAFVTATSEGGRFFGGMDKGSKTLQGTLSTLRDNITMLSLKLVGLSETGDVVKDGLFDKLSTAVNNLNSYFDTHKVQIDSVVVKFGEFITKTQEVIGWLLQYRWALEALVIAFTAVAAIVGSPIAALGLIIFTIVEVIRVCYELRGLWYDIWGLILSYTTQVQVRFHEIFGNIRNSIVGSFQSAANAIRGPINTIIGGINKIISGFNRLPGADIGLIPSFQTGGIMPYTGLAMLHKGEKITPSSSVTNNDNGVTVNFYGNIANTSNASLDEIANRIGRQIQLVSQGI